jgi:acyl carrier protein
MYDLKKVEEIVFNEIMNVSELKKTIIDKNSALIGNDSIIDSMKLVELCLSLEDIAEDLGFEFDWTSDKAMSTSRSMFKDAGSLSNEFLNQLKAN